MTTTDTTIARLLDEAAIRDVTTRFADLATHGDHAALRTLWAEDAEWVIGGTDSQPYERRADGVDDIMSLFRELRDGRDFFIQFVAPASIEVDGDEATARWLCHEAARGPGELYYRNNGVWTDHLRRTGDGWRFTNRSYHLLWLDFSPYTGDTFPI
ncbi:MAG: nuclear transport factor 2 family protein [Actinomycetia bacterium]|nr:nuclear transport factor 2 family protein [Actinomycetes bacterium]